MSEELRSELLEELTHMELLAIAKERGFQQELRSKEEIIDWLLKDGLTWKEYELKYNPYISTKLNICKFFGIREGWKVMDLGCGSGGTSVSLASLVGSHGKVIAVDPSEEEMKRCTRYIQKIGFEDTIETRLANVLDLEFEDNYFDMVLLLYTPQFIGYFDDLKQVLLKVKKWTSRIGVVDHIPFPVTYAESMYLLYNWLSNDVARISLGKRTDRLYHPDEIRDVLSKSGWKIVNEKEFDVSEKNAYPQWAMRENIKRLSEDIKMISDPVCYEIFSSRLLTLKQMVDAGFTFKPTTMYASLVHARG